jgi:hypothetical protein
MEITIFNSQFIDFDTDLPGCDPARVTIFTTFYPKAEKLQEWPAQLKSRDSRMADLTASPLLKFTDFL